MNFSERSSMSRGQGTDAIYHEYRSSKFNGRMQMSPKNVRIPPRRPLLPTLHNRPMPRRLIFFTRNPKPKVSKFSKISPFVKPTFTFQIWQKIRRMQKTAGVSRRIHFLAFGQRLPQEIHQRSLQQRIALDGAQEITSL